MWLSCVYIKHKCCDYISRIRTSKALSQMYTTEICKGFSGVGTLLPISLQGFARGVSNDYFFWNIYHIKGYCLYHSIRNKVRYECRIIHQPFSVKFSDRMGLFLDDLSFNKNLVNVFQRLNIESDDWVDDE